MRAAVDPRIIRTAALLRPWWRRWVKRQNEQAEDDAAEPPEATDAAA